MEAWGRFVHRHRLSVLAGSLVLLIISVGLLARGGTLKNSNNFDFEAGHAFGLIGDQLPKTSGVSFQLLMGSPTMTVGTPEFAAAADTALAPLSLDARVAAITAPPVNDTSSRSPEISDDRHYIITSVALKDDFFAASSYFPELRAEVHSPTLTIHPAGDLALNSDFTTISQTDLALAEKISLPLAMILLVVVFGSITAALLCLGVGAFAVMGGLAGMYELSHHTNVSIYALNIVSLVGLGVAIDYSLFIVNRFREELRRGASREDALALTMATAGRAIVFSGVTVAIGLCGLLFYSGTFLGSLGISGAMVVVVAVVYSLTMLPALLALLGSRVDALEVHPIIAFKSAVGQASYRVLLARKREAASTRRRWHQLAMGVMRRPWFVLIPCLAVLLLAGSPFPQMRLANASISLLPPNADARQGDELLRAHFSSAAENTVLAVLDFGQATPFEAQSISAAYEMTQRLEHTAGILQVESYVDLPTGGNVQSYTVMYAHGLSGLPQNVVTAVAPNIGTHIVLLRAVMPYAVPSDAARAVIADIHAHDQVTGATVLLTGDTAFDVDFVNFMINHSPSAVAFVMLATFAILLLLLRSIVLPIKAVVMNLLSLSAAFGAMVFIFQQGHLSTLLNFTPASIDPTLPILLFCIVYGLSMDYEVFLLTRMQEAYHQHGDNRRAVAEGLEASGRLVTGAAAIMISVFAAFALASVVVVKSVGLGMAIAVFVDATIVRALVVPALMRLLGNANWWAPRWMRPRRPENKQAAA